MTERIRNYTMSLNFLSVTVYEKHNTGANPGFQNTGCPPPTLGLFGNLVAKFRFCAL